MTVVATPDNSTELSCVPAVINVSSISVCTLTPRKGGQRVYSRNSSFTMGAGGSPVSGTVSNASPGVSQTLSATFTASSSVTGPSVVDTCISGGPSATITVVGRCLQYCSDVAKSVLTYRACVI